jgi:hypothetical protein
MIAVNPTSIVKAAVVCFKELLLGDSEGFC